MIANMDIKILDSQSKINTLIEEDKSVRCKTELSKLIHELDTQKQKLVKLTHKFNDIDNKPQDSRNDKLHELDGKLRKDSQSNPLPCLDSNCVKSIITGLLTAITNNDVPNAI